MSCNPRGQFLDREQAQVLPDLVRDLLLRSVVVIDCRHGVSPSQQNLTAASRVVTLRRPA